MHAERISKGRRGPAFKYDFGSAVYLMALRSDNLDPNMELNYVTIAAYTGTSNALIYSASGDGVSIEFDITS